MIYYVSLLVSCIHVYVLCVCIEDQYRFNFFFLLHSDLDMVPMVVMARTLNQMLKHMVSCLFLFSTRVFVVHLVAIRGEKKCQFLFKKKSLIRFAWFAFAEKVKPNYRNKNKSKRIDIVERKNCHFYPWFHVSRSTICSRLALAVTFNRRNGEVKKKNHSFTFRCQYHIQNLWSPQNKENREPNTQKSN